MPTAVAKALHGKAPRVVARAPGRLDAMGGFAEYTGSLIVNMPVGVQVCVGVQRGTAPQLTIQNISAAGSDGPSPIKIAMKALFDSDGNPVSPKAGLALVPDAAGAATKSGFGAVVEMLRSGLVNEPDRGLNLVISSQLAGLSDVGAMAAVAAATVVGICEVQGDTPEQWDLVRLCQRVENEWLGAPVGIGDATCALLGEPRTLTQVRCDAHRIGGTVQLPDDLVMVGIDCGAVHDAGMDKFARVRTAAFMGRALIDRIIQHERTDHMDWQGHLSRVSVTDYVERFRNRIPTNLKGRDYLERFGETGDPLTRIDAGITYKVRSRTEHHIYEHARVCQFVECLARAIRNKDEHALGEAGALMYASHWSYGQRCGLGSVETDLLVHLIRRHGTKSDIFGAKISGRGCGGTVAVLMRPTDRARAALDAASQAYQSQSGRTATLINGSEPGALVCGARRI